MGYSEGKEENLTSLGHMLQEWMWSQRPPLNQARLARHIGVTPVTIHKWFYGITKPDYESLAQTARATGLDIDDLFEAAGYPPLFKQWRYHMLSWAKGFPDLSDRARAALLEELSHSAPGANYPADQRIAEEAEYGREVIVESTAEHPAVTPPPKKQEPEHSTRSAPRRSRRERARMAPRGDAHGEAREDAR